jgi:hypothetical protein
MNDRSLGILIISSFKEQNMPEPQPFKQQHGQERIRQARAFSNLAYAMAVISGSIVFGGLVFFGMGKLSEGAIATVISAVSALGSERCFKMAQDANDRLDKLAHKD